MSIESELTATLANELNNSSWSFDGTEVASAVADAGGVTITMTNGSTWALTVQPTSDADSFEPDLVWDTSEFEHQDEMDEEFEEMTAAITAFMQKVNESGHWHVEARNFGWQHKDGSMDFVALDGRQFLRGVLPNTDCTYKIWLNEAEKKITIDNAHHDAPTGGEMYYATPAPEES